MKRIIIVICIVFLLTLLKPLIIEGEEVTLTTVPEDVIKEVALCFANDFYVHRDDIYITYDLSKVILLPIYDYKGNLLFYNTYVYLGEKETPTIDGILSQIEEPAREYYSYILEFGIPGELKNNNKNISDDIFNSFFHAIYIRPYYEFIPMHSGAGEGLWFDIECYWLAFLGVEKKFPESDIKFNRLILIEPNRFGYEFKISDKLYIVEINPFTYEFRIIPQEDIVGKLPTITSRLKNLLTEYHKQKATEFWNIHIDRVNNLKIKNEEGKNQGLNSVQEPNLNIQKKINMFNDSKSNIEIPPPQPSEYHIELVGCYSWDEDIPDFKQSDFAFGHLCAMTAAASILAFNTFQSQWAYYPGWLFEDYTNDPQFYYHDWFQGDTTYWDTWRTFHDRAFLDDDWASNKGYLHDGYGGQFQDSIYQDTGSAWLNLNEAEDAINTFELWNNIEENTIVEILEEHDRRNQESNIEMGEIIKKMIEDKGK